MPQFGKFQAFVVVDGEPLPEYSTCIAEATNTIACWIPSQEGKAFSVKFESEIYPKDIKAVVEVDGDWVGGKVLESRHRTRITVQFAEVFTSSTTSRELLFSRIELTDDDAFLNTNVIGLGEISLSVWEGSIGEACSSSTYKSPEKKIHERSKKALGHKVKFGEEMATKAQRFVKFTTGELLATFVFKYRPIDILRADGIAPPDPAANKRKADEVEDDGSEEEGGDEDEDQDENDERELKALLEKVNKIQNKLTKKTKPKKKLKTEPRHSVISGDVIDLT